MAEQFVDLFDRWAAVYDQSVAGNDVEYKDVFASYDKHLQSSDNRTKGDMIECIVEQRNLTKQLVDRSHYDISIKRSENMRIIDNKSQPDVTLVQDQFLVIPYIDRTVDTIASSYAF